MVLNTQLPQHNHGKYNAEENGSLLRATLQ